jgi:hypothetical protein
MFYNEFACFYNRIGKAVTRLKEASIKPIYMNNLNLKSNVIMRKPQITVFKWMLLTLLTVISLAGCEKKETGQNSTLTEVSPNPEVSSTSVDASTLAQIGYNIVCTNNANNKIEQFNLGDADWNAAGAMKWSWSPTTALGYNSTDVTNWNSGDPEGDPMDCKRRNTTVWSGVTQVIVAVGGNLATIARYTVTSGTSGSKIWAINVGAGAYPHAAELLPNGNLAVAATHGGWVRVYNTGGSNYAQFNIPWAHGVLWDPTLNLLWVSGNPNGAFSGVTALQVGGTRAAPTLTEVTSRRKQIPSGSAHDLSPFMNNTDRLLVSSTTGTYYLTKSTNTFTQLAGSAFRSDVKGLSKQPDGAGSGHYVQSRRNTACTLNTWCTATVDWYTVAGVYSGSRTRTGAAFYKAKTFDPNYQ